MMSIDFLNPAMSRLAVEGSPVVWDTSALGTPAASSYLGLNFAGAPTTAEVRIRWNCILEDAVHRLGGTRPVYVPENCIGGKFQARVNFSLPLDSRQISFADIDVIGAKCSTMFEAESEASAAALQVLQHGRLSIRVKDVSRTRCKDLENRCHEVLAHACKVLQGVKSLISNWENDMYKSERCYSPDRLKVAESISHGQEDSSNNIDFAVAEQLAYLIRANYLKLKDLNFKTEKVKIRIEKVHARVMDFFSELSFHEGNEHRGNLPIEIELRMELVLQEMITSIGWDDPKFNIISSGMSVYACETTLSPSILHSGPMTKALTITGREASSKEEAIESSCEAAISALESEKSICLVDLNYNHRSHGELYVVEAKEALKSAYSMGSKVLAEWEAMVDGIHTCKVHCQHLAADHPEAEQARVMYRMKYITTKSVSELHKACLSAFQFAERQFKNVDT